MNQIKQLAGLLNGVECVDLAPMLENDAPRWPTHPPLVINPTCTHAHDGVYIQTIFMPEHIGAHVDAPAHTVPSRPEATIETFPPNYIFGRAVLYNLKDLDVQPGKRVTVNQILELEKNMSTIAGKDDIVLLNFGWEQYWTKSGDWKFYAQNEPGFTEDAVKLFYDRKVRAVGSDTVASETPVKDGISEVSYAHKKYWLPNDILIIECLMNLDKLPTESYFMATPLKIKNGSGSPIRPIAYFPKQG